MRTRVKQPAATARTATITTESIAVFVECAQAPMYVVRDLADVDGLVGIAVNGAFIKVAPTVRASERQSLDSRAMVKRLVEAGAAAVVVAPIVVPDTAVAKKDEPRPAVQKPEVHLRAWLDGVKATKTVKDSALDEALTSVQEAGL